jgi:hypothetical protein
VYQRYKFEAEKRAALEAWALEVERIAKGKKATLTAAPLVVGSPVIEPASVDVRWPKAVAAADETDSFGPVIAYLNQPRARLGVPECWWLRQLLGRVQFKRKSRGQPVPLGHQSREQQYRIGVARMRDLQRREGLKHKLAFERTVRENPEWFAADAGAGFANYIRRGYRHK